MKWTLFIAVIPSVAIATSGCGDDKKKMVAEIESWGAEWQRERACLLGDEPYAKDAREAFAVRAVVAGSGGALAAECLKDTSLLRAGDARVDDQSVEAAWHDMNKAVESLLKARNELAGGNEDLAPSMARRIAAVDSIHARLRKRAGLPPAALPGAPLPEEPRGVLVGRTGDDASISTPVLRGNTLHIWQHSGQTESIVAVAGPSAIERYPLSDALPAASDDPWGVVVVPGPKWFEVQLTDGTVVAKEPARSIVRIDPVFAAGGERGRAVIYEIRGPARVVGDHEEWPPVITKVVAAEKEGSWKQVLAAKGVPAPSKFELDPYVYPDWVARRADIVWGDPEGNLYWTSIRDGAVSQPVRRPAGRISRYFDFDPVGCFADTHGWVLSDRKLWFARGDDSAAVDVPGYTHTEAILQCNDDHVVRVWPDYGDSRHFQRCTPEGCTPPTAAESIGALGLGRDGTTLTAFVRHGVLFVRPEAEPARPAFRISSGSTLYGVMHTAEGWQALMLDADGARLVPLGP